MEQNCPFCEIKEKSEHSSMPSNALAFIHLDGFPVSQGHLLVIPNRHAADWFDLTLAEQQANCGTAAGQTVLHMHCHLIPRYAGDQPDPRGGVRWVIPEKADYWSGR